MRTRRGRRMQRQPDGECRAAIDDALQLDASAEAVNQAANDIESESDAALALDRRVLAAVKWLEDAFDFTLRYADARVRDAQNYSAPFLKRFNRNPSAIGKLDGVVEQILQDDL